VARTLASIAPDAARRILEHEVDLVEALPGDYDYSHEIKELVTAASSSKHFDLSSRLVRHVRNEVLRREAIDVHVRALAENGRVEDAIDMVAGQPAKRIELLLAAGRIEGALEAAKKVYHSSAVKALLAANRFEDAERRAASIEDARDGFLAYVALLRNAPAKPDTVKDLAASADALAGALGYAASWARTELIEVLAVSGYIDLASELVPYTDSSNRYRCDSIIAVASAMVRAGDPRGPVLLRQVLDHIDMVQEHQRDSVRLNVAEAMHWAGMFEEAKAVVREVRENTGADRYLAQRLALLSSQWGQLGQGIEALDGQPVDWFMHVAAELVQQLASERPEQAVAALAGAARVLGWIRPDWGALADWLSAASRVAGAGGAAGNRRLCKRW
jgi:hypothetical protein